MLFASKIHLQSQTFRANAMRFCRLPTAIIEFHYCNLMEFVMHISYTRRTQYGHVGQLTVTRYNANE